MLATGSQTGQAALTSVMAETSKHLVIYGRKESDYEGKGGEHMAGHPQATH